MIQARHYDESGRVCLFKEPIERPVKLTQPDIWLAELRLTRFESLSASDVKQVKAPFVAAKKKKFFERFK